VPANEGKVVKETEFMGYPLISLEKMKIAARIGYMSMNLYEPPAAAEWGRFNDRKISRQHVNALYNDFDRAVENCNESDCIDVALRPEWLENLGEVKKGIEGLTIDEVPLMDFTVKGESDMRKEKLIMLGGNHRREALKKHIDLLNGWIQNLEKKFKAMSGEDYERTRPLKVEIDEKKKEVDRKSRWAVRLYDIGECDI
jgi:hypothetical protein